MDNKDKSFIWSDNWWIEEDTIWFVGGMSNILFRIKRSTGECEEAINIPDSDDCKMRLNPICIKKGKDIFCIPGFGQNIWVYNLDTKSFTRIIIDKPERYQLRAQVWMKEDALFVVSEGWNKVMEVSTRQKVINNYYMICEKDRIQRSILVDQKIFMVSSDQGKVYEFDLSTKKTQTYSLPFGKKKLFTICFDGKKFWLSGYEKELYVWDKESNDLVTIDAFPEDFGVYDFKGKSDVGIDCKVKSYEFSTFLYSVAAGEYIWFIPRQTNKIIYINRKNYIVCAFEIPEENETKKSILDRGAYGFQLKYLLEYVRDDRYIGLFSAKHSRILEIDAKQLLYEWKDYYFSDVCLKQCNAIYQGSYYEGHDALYDLIYRRELMAAHRNNDRTDADSVGMEIYRSLVLERNLE